MVEPTHPEQIADLRRNGILYGIDIHACIEQQFRSGTRAVGYERKGVVGPAPESNCSLFGFDPP
jgi:hypothetical protein